MIDRQARDQTAEVFRHFIAGRISNFEFEERIPSSDDPIIYAIRNSAWCFYNDFEEHKLIKGNGLMAEIKSNFARWIMFLYADDEYVWPPIAFPGIRPLKNAFFEKLFGAHKKEKIFMSSGEYKYWPFVSKDSYLRAMKNPRLLSGARTIFSD